MEYHKIQTVWLRDPDTNHKTLIEGAWAKPEFEYLANQEWLFTEKVDGTNIRIMVESSGVRLGGRTDRAQLPSFLIERLQEIGEAALAADLRGLTLYGEGYGAKIQKGGGNYIPDYADFVLFDVRGRDLWLDRESVEDIADKISIRSVPTIASGTLEEAIQIAREGFDSRWGSFPAEGLVMRPAVELSNRRGERVIAKIKCKDFPDAAKAGAEG